MFMTTLTTSHTLIQQPPQMHQGGPLGPQQGPPRYPPNQGQWNGPTRPNGPRPGPPNGPPQRPQMVTFE